MSLHRLSLIFLYSITIAVTVYLIVVGGEYYAMAKIDRPHSELHKDWKPSGLVSHGLGIIGTAMILLLLLYTARKRFRFMQNWGSIRYWLNYHIWLGVTGPILVLFHTTFKFGGIVSVSFWSMVAVVLSGVIGRYIYIQIPRSLSGNELSENELWQMEKDLENTLLQERGVDEKILKMIREASGSEEKENTSELSMLWAWLTQDLKFPFKMMAVKRVLLNTGLVSNSEMGQIMKLARKQSKLHRRIAFLSTARSLLHHWHIFHKPFAIIMILIMLVHVGITVALGYWWIFK